MAVGDFDEDEVLGDEPDWSEDDGLGDDEIDPDDVDLGGLISLRGLIEVHKWPQRMKWNVRKLAAFTLLPFEQPLGYIDRWRKRRRWQKALERQEEEAEWNQFLNDPELEGLLWQYDEERLEQVFKEWKARKAAGDMLRMEELEFGEWGGGTIWEEKPEDGRHDPELADEMDDDS